MYIRTPQRYRGMQRRRVFSCQRFLLFFLMLIIIAIGIGIYEMRDLVRPQMMGVVDAGMNQVESWQATQFAPTPMPTTDPSTILIDADNEWEAGRISFALNAYENVLDLTPNDVGVYTHLAEGYLTRGNIETALEYADDTVTANPFSADAWATRSLVYSWDDNSAEGIASAQQALAFEPENARAMAYLAYAYFQAGQDNLASNRAEDAIELNPDDWSGYWIRGLIRENVFPIDLLSAQSDFETAYNLAKTQNPAMAGAVGSGLGRVVSSLGDDNRAVQLLNEMLTIDDSNREVLYYLGRIIYGELGDYAQAQDPFLDCVDVAPADYNCWYMLGRTLERLGDQEGALDAFESAIENETPYARHYWWAANTERNLGSCTAATPYLEIGYDMVANGGLSASDEGDATLLSAFEDELATCRIVIVPDVIAPELTPDSDTTDG